jgi:hypothetical protein
MNSYKRSFDWAKGVFGLKKQLFQAFFRQTHRSAWQPNSAQAAIKKRRSPAAVQTRFAAPVFCSAAI